jgi:hypothetical protein
MPTDKYASREWRARIREVLNRDWDPIGGCPADEYDRYVGELAAMIRANASDDDLIRHLEWAEAKHMGFGKVDPERARRVIDQVRGEVCPLSGVKRTSVCALHMSAFDPKRTSAGRSD